MAPGDSSGLVHGFAAKARAGSGKQDAPRAAEGEHALGIQSAVAEIFGERRGVIFRKSRDPRAFREDERAEMRGRLFAVEGKAEKIGERLACRRSGHAAVDHIDQKLGGPSQLTRNVVQGQSRRLQRVERPLRDGFDCWHYRSLWNPSAETAREKSTLRAFTGGNRIPNRIRL